MREAAARADTYKQEEIEEKGGSSLASSKVTQRMFDSYLKLCPLPKWPNKDLSDEESRGVALGVHCRLHYIPEG